MSIRADIVKDYLVKHADVPSRTMARYLLNRHPGLWEDLTQVLSQIRYYRGAAGEKNRHRRRNMDDRDDYKRIPTAAKPRYRTVKLKAVGRWFVMGDLHIPYHDQRAVETAVNFAIDEKCNHLILNGDILDAYQVSQWVKDPGKRNIDKEIEKAKELIKAIEGNFKGEKVYKIGNHEERIENYMFQNAPRMVGMSKWDLRKVLREALDLGDDWKVIAGKQLYTLGKLNAYHGHELPKGLTNPVSVGRGLWNRTRQSGFTNHWHRTSGYVESSGDKSKKWVCFSIGCLCNLTPEFSPVNGWNHGACSIRIDKNGNFSEKNIRIDDGSVW